MASLRAAEVTLAVALASLCLVTGLTTLAVGSMDRRLDSHYTFSASSTLAQPQRAFARKRRSRDFVVPQAMTGEGDDSIEEYKKQMAEFMAEAHDKRLQAMEAVKAEVQRGYEEQIAELQSKLSALPTTGASAGGVAAPVRTAERELVGAGTRAPGGSIASSGRAPHHAYAARLERPGWDARWGSEEAERAATLSAPSLSSTEARVEAAVSPGGTVHPAYAARLQRAGWETRWGDEEVARAGGAIYVGSKGTDHPAYAARAQRPGWEARWGDEEAARTEGEVSVGAEANVHPAYAARSQRPGWEARWGSEEPARMAAATNIAGDSSAASTQAQAGAVLPVEAHPAYSARLGRLGWEARWGDEEKDRVTGASAGVIAVAGAAAGVATAGGLDATSDDAATGPASTSVPASSVQLSAENPLEDNLLPDDVAELKSMVVSFRQHFQDYLMRSLEATNQLKQSKAQVDAELSSATVKLAAEKELRESLQESYLAYMSRSGDTVANGKTRISELEGDAVRLTEEAQELQRFTQEYMVKASGDKQKAIEEAVASVRSESAERIAALQAQVLELQAGG